MSKDARELVTEMSAVYRDAEEARVANYARLNQDAQLRDRPICAGQTVWILFLEPVTLENAINHPGYVLLAGEVRDTRETSYEVAFDGRVQTFERAQLYIRRGAGLQRRHRPPSGRAARWGIELTRRHAWIVLGWRLALSSASA